MKSPGKLMAFLLAGMLSASFSSSALAGNRKASPYAKLDIFGKVLALIERNHVKETDEEKLITGAIKGMLRSLDPHSSFLSAEDFKILRENTEGNFCGVGLEVSIRNDELTVITPIPDSPAMEAGILPGDVILEINGQPTTWMDIEESVKLMRGREETRVTVTLFREGTEAPFEVTLTRQPIEIQSVKSELIEPGFVHLEVISFTDGTSARIRKAFRQARFEGGEIKGLILDLRRNPGGLMYEAVKVSDLFMKSGNIVSTRGKNGAVIESFSAHKPGTLEETPMAVLIDGASASASEIVAGALKESRRALLVGTRTFGKGSVQTIIPLRDGSGLKLTTALYYTPEGVSIQARGIEPDVLIESRTAPSKTASNEDVALMPAEKDLPGHLISRDLEDADTPMVPEDFQLRVAFQIVKSLVEKRVQPGQETEK